MIGAGGSSLCAAVLIFARREEGTLASVAAGLMMTGFIAGEVVLLKQGISWIEGLYGGLGLLISTLAAYLWVIEHRPHRWHIRHA